MLLWTPRDIHCSEPLSVSFSGERRAFVRPDCSYAVKELSRDVKGPTIESLSKLKHLLRYLSGTK